MRHENSLVIFESTLLADFSNGSLSLVAFFLFLTFFFSGSTLNAQDAVATRRPSNVPKEYVVTPFGYLHPTCVKHINDGDEVRRDLGVVLHADGSSEALSNCAYPRYNAVGQFVSESTPAANQPSASGSYVVDEYVSNYGSSSGSSYSQLSGSWNVPSAPTANDGQTLFLFPGLVDGVSNLTILQPVLAWNNGTYPNAWSIASYNCCMGSMYESPAKPVSTGDVISGNIKSTCGAGVLSCPTWNVTTTDVTSGATTTLSQTSNYGQTFDLAFGGVLEEYNVVSCNDFPPNDFELFSNISLYDYNDVLLSPVWELDVPAPLSLPKCDYGGQSNAQQVQLNYGVPAPHILPLKSCLLDGGHEVCLDTVNMSDAVTPAFVYYTTDGSTPTPSSTLYSGPVFYSVMTTFKAIAESGTIVSGVTTVVANP